MFVMYGDIRVEVLTANGEMKRDGACNCLKSD